MSQLRQALGQLRPNDFPGHIDFAADGFREGDQHLSATGLLYAEKRLATIIVNPAHYS
jgi:hypothetical protein